MAFQIVLLSGRVASGKTTLWQQLIKNFPGENIHVLKTKNVIRDLASKKLGQELPAERRALQDFGDKLDRETAGMWVRDALVSLINQHTSIEASSTSGGNYARSRRRLLHICGGRGRGGNCVGTDHAPDSS